MKWTTWFTYELDQWVINDQLTGLNLAQEGAFHRLLRYQWRYGQIPPSFEKLAAIVGCSGPTIHKMWDEALKPLFPKGQNENLKVLREKAQERSRKKSRTNRRRQAEQEPENMPEPDISRETWATPYAIVWRDRFGGEPPWGQLARYIKPLQEKHGVEITVAAFIRFCAEADPKFVSLARFNQTFGTWLPEEPRTPLLSEMTPSASGSPVSQDLP